MAVPSGEQFAARGRHQRHRPVLQQGQRPVPLDRFGRGPYGGLDDGVGGGVAVELSKSGLRRRDCQKMTYMRARRLREPGPSAWAWTESRNTTLCSYPQTRTACSQHVKAAPGACSGPHQNASMTFSTIVIALFTCSDSQVI